MKVSGWLIGACCLSGPNYSRRTVKISTTGAVFYLCLKHKETAECFRPDKKRDARFLKGLKNE